MILFCDATLKRKLWIEAACEALKDYRDPDHEVTAQEYAGLAMYADDELSPATAAELYQAATG